MIGDLAAIAGDDGAALPGVAQVAIQSGKWAAGNIARTVAVQTTLKFRYRDLGSMATIGRNRAIAVIGGHGFSGFPAWLIWAAIHIRSLIEFRSRAVVTFQWAWAYLTHRRSARLITGDNQRRD